MKFLIALKNTTDESKNILEIGCKIAEGFSADLTICYIGKQSRALIEGDVNLARQTLSEWNIHHPGLEVLEWAFNILKEKGFAPDSEFNIKNLVEEKGRMGGSEWCFLKQPTIKSAWCFVKVIFYLN